MYFCRSRFGEVEKSKSLENTAPYDVLACKTCRTVTRRRLAWIFRKAEQVRFLFKHFFSFKTFIKWMQSCSWMPNFVELLIRTPRLEKYMSLLFRKCALFWWKSTDKQILVSNNNKATNCIYNGHKWCALISTILTHIWRNASPKLSKSSFFRTRIFDRVV